MTVTRANIDELNAVLKVKVEKADYAEKVENVLRDYRRKANIKGFRPGMVPIGMIKKMYGTAVKVDEINKTINESVHKYLHDEKIEILGDPMPREEEQNKLDFENSEEFDFAFELGLTPSFDLGITPKTKVPFYEIVIDDKMKSDYISNYTRRYGEFRMAESTEDKDILKGKVEAIDADGNLVPEGPANDFATLAVDIIKDEDIKKSFIGSKVNDTVDFDIKKAFPNDNEVAGLLKIKKEEAEPVSGNFRFTISEVTRFHPAELNTELYDKIYGEGVIATEEDFNKKIEDEIGASLKVEGDYKLMVDLKKVTTESTEFQLPEDFLKRWLLHVNENTTAEQIEKEFDSFKSDLKWQLIKNKVAKENDLKISEEELQKEAQAITRQQFRQYGLYYATDEQVANYAAETLKREEDARRIAEKIIEDKVIGILKEKVKLENKSVTVEEFNKLFE